MPVFDCRFDQGSDPRHHTEFWRARHERQYDSAHRLRANQFYDRHVCCTSAEHDVPGLYWCAPLASKRVSRQAETNAGATAGSRFNVTSLLADVQIYPVALTATQLASLSNGQSTTGCTVTGTAFAATPPAPSGAGALSSPPSPPPPSPPPPLPLPSPSPPAAAPVTVAAVAACPAGTTLTGASTVTYTVSQFAGITPVSLANGINAALASSQSVTGLEKAGVTVDWNLPGSGGSATSTGALFSSATGLRCGFLAGGVLNRTGFPADGSGAQVLLNSTSSSSGGQPTLPAYLGTPVTLVCSSCITWTAPPTVACGPTHRYSGATVVAATSSYSTYGQNGPVQLSGAVLNMTDVGSTPTGPALATQLPLTGVSATIQQVRLSRGVFVALQH